MISDLKSENLSLGETSFTDNSSKIFFSVSQQDIYRSGNLLFLTLILCVSEHSWVLLNKEN